MKLNTYLYLTFFMFISKGMDAKSIEIGATIPTVQATLDSGNMLDLASSSAEGYTLVYFYPKANTPGCTKQACSLRDAYEVLVEKGVKVYGVSKDSVKSQTSFKEK